jgi:hypothetical protein
MSNSLITRALIAAYTSVETSGSLIEDVCKAAQSQYKGEAIPKADRDTILEALADNREWEGDSRKVRKSEAGAILKAYPALRETVKHVRENKGACSWNESLSLARCLNRSKLNVKQAIAAFNAGGTNKTASPSGRAAGALKAWFKVARGDKKAAILKAATLLGLEIE